MTRLVKFANNAASTLAAGITNSATSLTVAPGDGAKFPALSGSQYFMATLVKSTGETEVVKVTARATDTFAIARAQEQVGGAATAYAYSPGDRIEMRITSGLLGSELDRLDAAALPSVASKTANYTVLAADIHNLIRVDTTSGARTITLPSIASLTDDFDILIAKVTGDANLVTVTRSSTDTINGAPTYTLQAQWSAAWLIADRATNTWTAISTGNAGANGITDTFTPSNSAGPFTLSADPGSKNNTAVYVGGVYQQKSTYTLTGTSLTLGGATSAPVEVVYSTPLSIGTPADGSVTAAKLASPLNGPINESQGTDIASAATVNLNAATGNYLRITGTTTITAFTLSTGYERTIVFTGAVTLTNSANLILPSGANITTAPGDTCVIRGEASGVVRCVSYTRYDGTALVAPAAISKASQAEAIAGTDDTKFMSALRVQDSIKTFALIKHQVIALSGAAAYDITIPARVARVHINMTGVGTNGSSPIMFQLASGGSVLTSGYVAAGSINNGSAVGTTGYSTGFGLANAKNGSETFYGDFDVSRIITSNTYVSNHVVCRSGSAAGFGGGAVNLSGSLDRIRLTTQNGTDLLNAGTISVYLEY